MMHALYHWTNLENAKTVKYDFDKKITRNLCGIFIYSKFLRGNLGRPRNYMNNDMYKDLHTVQDFHIHHDKPIYWGWIYEHCWLLR